MATEENSNNNETGKGNFVERLADKLGISANATKIYGEAVERDGATVIPVAKARYGFGGGRGTKGDEKGFGGGGGVAITPVGFIEMKDGTTKFRSIRDPETVMKIVAISGLFTFLTVRSIMKRVKP
ncbi:spore germination protein GerW family protein [Pontibacter sp. MBLB2868]|uniref:spore germination protein GerW family protein n=1 Tax=Pontibacter sp. MBLB2868 TaxID=3451555 RepID=UPI003F755743